MVSQTERFREALRSGDSDQVNDVIDDLQEMEPAEKVELFDECFEMATNVYESGDGYQRQSVVRFVQELYPRPPLFEAVQQAESPAAVVDQLFPRGGEWAERLQAFYLDALEDDDGRVRQAAQRGLEELCRLYEMVDATEDIDAIIETLEDLGTRHSGKTAEHIWETHDRLVFQRQHHGNDQFDDLFTPVESPETDDT